MTTTSPHWLAVRERQQALLEQAQRGEDTRNELIMQLQPILKSMATRCLVERSKWASAVQTLEGDDLVHSAIVRMLVKFSEALSKENPLGYLLGVAKYTMLECVGGRNELIKRYASEKAIPILSLDMPLAEDADDGAIVTLADQIPYEVHLPAPDAAHMFETVEQAIAALSGKQRLVIDRVFGFHEQAPTSLNQISRDLSPASPRPRNAHYHHQRALATLRRTLAPSFPRYASAGGAQ